MKNTKLAEALAACSKEELKKIELWLKSPVHCTDGRLLLLFNLLVTPSKKSALPEKPRLFAKLFPGKKYNEALLRNLASDLLSCIEDFFVWNRLKSFSSFENYLLLRVYNEKKLSGLFEMRLKQFEKIYEPLEEPIFDSSLGLLLVEEEKALFSFMSSLSDKKKALKNDELQQTLKLLIRSFLIKYLHYYLITLNNELSVGQKSNTLSDFTHFMLKTAEDLFASDLYISVSALLIKQSLGTQQEDEFRRLILQKIKSPGFQQLCNEDKRNVYTTTVNHFTACFTKGNLEIIPELTELMDLALQARAPIWFNVISGPFFSNYVTFNLCLGKEKAVESFIREYAPLLEASTRELTENLALANFAFYKKDYATTQRYLSLVMPNSPLRFLGVKNLLLKVYFERKDFEQIPAISDSIRHKLMNEENISEGVKKAEKNFMKFFHKLLLLADGKKKGRDAVSLLKAEINATEYVMQKHWLMEKVREMEKPQ